MHLIRTLHARMIQKGLHLSIALVGLGLAIVNPRITIPLDFHHYLFVIDITQSMNVDDMSLNGRPASRLKYAINLVGLTLKELPCGTKVSIALFANAEIVPLYIPIEVCANFAILQDTLSHIEWRMAWRGSSHLRLGLQDAAGVLLRLPEPAQIILLTDGDEAAPINAITKIDLLPTPGSDGWLLAGIGSLKPSPVPKFNSKNEVIGYWSQYATKIEPSQIVNEDSVGKRDDSIASDPHEYYLSVLQEDYLKEMAHDIGASYIRADSRNHMLSAIKKLPPPGHGSSPVNLGWIFALLAGLFVLAEYLPLKAK